MTPRQIKRARKHSEQAELDSMLSNDEIQLTSKIKRSISKDKAKKRIRINKDDR